MLDFDGVLHPVDRDAEVFCRWPLLAKWLRRYPAVMLMVTSSWREVHDIERLRGLFEGYGHRVEGATEVGARLWGKRWQRSEVDRQRTKYERRAEIEHWIDRHAPGSSWVALDDQPELFEPGCRRLVLCDGRVGLAERELAEAERVLALPRRV